MNENPKTVDVLIRFEGDIFQFRPMTVQAEDATNELHIESWQWMGNWFCVDRRFAETVLQFYCDEGFTVG